MPEEKRRILTEEEKKQLLAKHKDCYICLGSLANYERSEIQFDHIYNYADGYPQELFNFAICVSDVLNFDDDPTGKK
jgi:hypothetical protein